MFRNGQGAARLLRVAPSGDNSSAGPERAANEGNKVGSGMDNVGIVIDDLAAAIAFCSELGFRAGGCVALAERLG